ncbi:MAG TPA: hypothetical protein PKM67_11455 [Kiritimatiellia bacterium]|nr:hypothetical protein [Kiritimatiellia bacterium]HNS82063.1 hypothetical protein [Kiritimatiellia bacterium]
MTRCLLVLLLLLVTGCATRLEKAERLMARGEYVKARGYYQQELDIQQNNAHLPQWTGRAYRYSFVPANAAKAILGVGNSYKEQKLLDNAFYHYSYFIQFSLRHNLNFDKEISRIENWILENGPVVSESASGNDQIAVTEEIGPSDMTVMSAETAAQDRNEAAVTAIVESKKNEPAPRAGAKRKPKNSKAVSRKSAKLDHEEENLDMPVSR